MSLFGTSGIRQKIDITLLQLALNLGLAVGSMYKRVVIGRDTRTSGEAMKNAFMSGLLSSGADCYDAGVIPTPTLTLAAEKLDAGVMITASHNPPEYNGIKLFNPDGSSFDSAQREQIERIISENMFNVTSWDNIKYSREYEGAVEKHIEKILKDIPSVSGTRVVLDCGCGAASVITPSLLNRMGCEVVELNCNPSGFCPRGMEPVESNLEDLMRMTKEFSADVGIAHDGDADRMMAVDDMGRFISGDRLLAIFSQNLNASTVITTLDASMAIEDMGYNVVRTKIGDPYVCEELGRGGDFGGEPSGSWIFPKVSMCPDGIYAAAQIVAIAARQKLSLLVDKIPSFPILRGNISIDDIAMSEVRQQIMTMNPVSVDEIDGIRLTFEDGWLLIRASGTEAKIRVVVEAKAEMRTRELYDSAVNVIKRCIKKKVGG